MANQVVASTDRQVKNMIALLDQPQALTLPKMTMPPLNTKITYKAQYPKYADEDAVITMERAYQKLADEISSEWGKKLQKLISAIYQLFGDVKTSLIREAYPLDNQLRKNGGPASKLNTIVDKAITMRPETFNVAFVREIVTFKNFKAAGKNYIRLGRLLSIPRPDDPAAVTTAKQYVGQEYIDTADDAFTRCRRVIDSMKAKCGSITHDPHNPTLKICRPLLSHYRAAAVAHCDDLQAQITAPVIEEDCRNIIPLGYLRPVQAPLYEEMTFKENRRFWIDNYYQYCIFEFLKPCFPIFNIMGMMENKEDVKYIARGWADHMVRGWEYYGSFRVMKEDAGLSDNYHYRMIMEHYLSDGTIKSKVSEVKTLYNNKNTCFNSEFASKEDPPRMTAQARSLQMYVWNECIDGDWLKKATSPVGLRGLEASMETMSVSLGSFVDLERM